MFEGWPIQPTVAAALRDAIVVPKLSWLLT